ncbi:MAG: DUF2207 domain-containing protein [Bifidobacterium sp.]|nr:DUF2207 domain-containing protein [Bifidobacterium sp.]
MSDEFEAFGLVHEVWAVAKVVLAFVVAAVLAFFYLHHLWTTGLPALAMVMAVVLVFVAVLILELMPTEVLSDNGYKEAGKILGLRKYLEDFSDFPIVGHLFQREKHL